MIGRPLAPLELSAEEEGACRVRRCHPSVDRQNLPKDPRHTRQFLNQPPVQYTSKLLILNLFLLLEFHFTKTRPSGLERKSPGRQTA